MILYPYAKFQPNRSASFRSNPYAAFLRNYYIIPEQPSSDAWSLKCSSERCERPGFALPLTARAGRPPGGGTVHDDVQNTQLYYTIEWLFKINFIWFH